jgi:hypothetical protein
MAEKPTGWTYALQALGIVLGAWLLYTALTLLAPNTSSSGHFHMSFFSLDVLRLTIIIPALAIWIIAIQGATSFKNYAAMITGSHEGQAVNLMANGLLWLVAYMILSSLMSSLDPFLQSPLVFHPYIILRDHLPALFGLIGFALIFVGSNSLKSVVKFSTWTWAWTTLLIMGLFALFAVGFVLDFSSQTVITQPANIINSSAIVPIRVLLFTLILPYLISWFVGILAAINIFRYSQMIDGILYRRALRSLVWGIVTVILFAMAVQVTTFADKFLVNLSLGALLLIVYVFVLFYALGFFFIWMGAKQLKRLEALE